MSLLSVNDPMPIKYSLNFAILDAMKLKLQLMITQAKAMFEQTSHLLNSAFVVRTWLQVDCDNTTKSPLLIVSVIPSTKLMPKVLK